MFCIQNIRLWGLRTLLLLLPLCAAGQGTQIEFGKNRVQYKDFEWSYYDSENFRTYFYLGGQDIGKSAVIAAESNLKEIEEKLEYRVSDQIDILVYNDISDLKQTNIGIGLEDNYNIGGVTNIIGNKIFVYFNGDHAHLERQIRRGITSVFLHDMMYGGSIQDVVQNAVLLNLPNWYTEGLIAFIAEEWNTELDNQVRDGILSGELQNFNRFSYQHPEFAGHALWYYISERYGDRAVSNILYLTRINRSMESGFVFVLNKSLSQIVEEWYLYNLEKYKLHEDKRNFPEETKIIFQKKKKRLLYNMSVSPDGEKLVYVTNELGKYKVYIHNTKTGKRKKILKGGFKSVQLPIDKNYPLTAWNPTGAEVAILYVKRDRIYLMQYNVESEEKKIEEITKFQSVLNISYMDPRTLVISAMNRGQSDIYTYHLPSSRTEQITKDFWDDLQPHFISTGGRKGILFISNRLNDTLKVETRIDTTLPPENFDLFFYDYEKKSDVLVRVTNSPLSQEQFPLKYNEEHFSYLSDKNGIYNRFAAYFDSTFSHYDTIVHYRDSVVTNPAKADSIIQAHADLIDAVKYREVYKDTAISFPITNFKRNILEQSYAEKDSAIAQLFIYDNYYEVYLDTINPTLSRADSRQLINTVYRNHTLTEYKATNRPPAEAEPDTVPTDTAQQEFYFQNRYYGPSTAVPKKEEAGEDRIFISSRVLPYRLKFSLDNVVTQMDNSLIFTKYEKFTGGNLPRLSNPSPSPLIKLAVSDLLEDYKLMGGFRIPTNLSGSEYFVQFQNLKRRLDKKLLYYRKSNLSETNFTTSPSFSSQFGRFRLNYLQLELSWPLDIIRSFRGYAGYRNDKTIPLATDSFTLVRRPDNEHWGMVRLEYVFDNTIPIMLNILDGARYKVYTEFYKQVNEQKTWFTAVGGDFRHYLPLHRQIIWANRFVTAASLGPSRIIYYLGGVDNALFPRYSSDTNLPDVNIEYQTVGTNLRGNRNNVRNGTSYAIYNTELRVPVFSYLIRTPIRSAFIKNFQLVGFGDVGTAWQGLIPDFDENAFNTRVIDRRSLTGNPRTGMIIRVNEYITPIVAGYGLGVRTMLFGYFIRVSAAWPVEKTDSKAMWHFSLSLDF